VVLVETAYVRMDTLRNVFEHQATRCRRGGPSLPSTRPRRRCRDRPVGHGRFASVVRSYTIGASGFLGGPDGQDRVVPEAC
jgi:hypothetical protein